MSNITGPTNSGQNPEILTSASVSVLVKSLLGPYITSASASVLVSALTVNFITSASVSTMVSVLTVNFITSASTSTMIASFQYVTSAIGSTRYAGRGAVLQITSVANDGTITINDATDVLYIAASALASAAINLPVSAVTGKLIRIASKDAIIAVSVSGAGLVGGITALGANGFAEYIFTGTAWVRVG